MNHGVKKNKESGLVGLFTVIVVFVIIAVIGIFSYLLFFSIPPRTETVLPKSLESANEISKIQFVDLTKVVNSEAFKSLKPYGPLLGVGTVGRSNPFIDYKIEK